MAAISPAPPPLIPLPPPLGDDPLQLRAELARRSSRCSRSRRGCTSTRPRWPSWAVPSAEMRSPWVFAVVGEVKAGKSQFLNALFGRDVCRTDLLPATDRVHLFRYALEPRDAAEDAPVAEHFGR